MSPETSQAIESAPWIILLVGMAMRRSRRRRDRMGTVKKGTPLPSERAAIDPAAVARVLKGDR